jgi:hypothetical protein
MQFKPVKDGNFESHHNHNAKESMPLGAVKRKTPKAGRWNRKRPKKDQGASFSLTGSCSGELSEVMSLGMKLCREEMDKGNTELAQRILNRVKKIPMEYERARQIATLKRQIARLSTNK